MINAGKYNKKITINRTVRTPDASGFKHDVDTLIGTYWAEVRNMAGTTVIRLGSDWEQATTRCVIRVPAETIKRDDTVLYDGRRWRILYVRNVNEAGAELELQAEEVTK